MKSLLASLITAVVVAGGAHAYNATVTPAQFARLEARVKILENFKRNCLSYHVRLTENRDGYMVWGVGLPTPHAASFYALPNTEVIPAYC
jgi:hypothetical protein